MGRISKLDVYEIISQSIFYGNLGYFIGAGFSKSVANLGYSNPALSWGELISKAAEKLDINYSLISKEGYSYPEIATAVCEAYMTKNGIDYENAKKVFKEKVCELTSWLPREEKRKLYSDNFDIAKPSWIVTTNYDRVLESILVGKGFSIGPNEYLKSSAKLIPIYHMHGTRENPESIILTQDDYVKLFRPNEYRQVKLALSIRESTTLILGYSLGDMNVLSALDWSKNIYEGDSRFPHEIIQVVRCESPKDEAYKDKNGIIIIEIDEIDKFFQDIIEYHNNQIVDRASLEEKIQSFVAILTASEEQTVNEFVTDREMRLETLKVLARLEEEIITSFMILLSKSLDFIWEKAIKPNAFGYYATYLEILLDIIDEIDYQSTPPVLFGKLAHSLDNVLRYVGDTFGNSYAATSVWNARKLNISEKYLNELANYAERTNLHNMSYAIDDLRKIKAYHQELHQSKS